jgi:putative SOS response-associated peptidase YedK
MCGRITQINDPASYAEVLAWMNRDRWPILGEHVANYNASPGAKHWTMRVFHDEPFIERVRWQYLSPWAAKKGMPPAINARIDKLLTPYYRGLMNTGRIIVPANGWYEWVGEKGGKQPWYIKAKDGAPLFFAALTNHDPTKEGPEGVGFVIVTDASAGGMVDVHDRRPVALAVEDAILWMDAGISYEQAEQIARTTAIREEYFEWYRVSRDVNGTRLHDAHLIEPIIE